MKRFKGFTLIELLIVVAIIAILAAIAIPNFLAAQIRSKVSRVKAEQQSLATAMESYYIDSNVYPRADQANQISTSLGWNGGAGDYNTDGGMTPRALTTPIAYITSLSHDPFKKNGNGYYGYGGGPVGSLGYQNTWPTYGWIAVSYGPDNSWGYSGHYLQEESGWTDGTGRLTPPGITLEESSYTYNPTNGITSGGDIWRRGP